MDFGDGIHPIATAIETQRRFQEQMTGIFNPAGWGAYCLNGALFVKRASVIPGAEYPDFGCNFEIFTNPEFLELESLGPESSIGAGRKHRPHRNLDSLPKRSRGRRTNRGFARPWRPLPLSDARGWSR
jgi:hypothetical protein